MKYQLTCCTCGHVTPDFGAWFAQNQTCPQCGSKHSEVHYEVDYTPLQHLYNQKADSFWHYFNYLPLMHRENIVSLGEGATPIEHWSYLERYAAERHDIHCNVLAYRNDLNGGTGTLKDPAASLGASLFREYGIKEYCLSSTGNTATAYARYLAEAGVRFTNFAPFNISPDSVNEIQRLGQHIEISEGDYGRAKQEATDYAATHHVLITWGNFDPIRIEAKRTMAFEFIRLLGCMPDVYMQAVAGGTGPIALNKGVRELSEHLPNIHMPRMILVQQDLCDPMVQGWETAVKTGFPEGYEENYPKVDATRTSVSILTAGNPGMYPLVAPMVRRSGGTFVRVAETDLPQVAAKVHQERGALIGPAAAVCVAGFYRALETGHIHQGDTVVVNIGESCRRNTAFAAQVQALE